MMGITDFHVDLIELLLLLLVGVRLVFLFALALFLLFFLFFPLRSPKLDFSCAREKVDINIVHWKSLIRSSSG